MTRGRSVVHVEFPLEKSERQLWAGEQIDRGSGTTASNVVGAIMGLLIVGTMVLSVAADEGLTGFTLAFAALAVVIGGAAIAMGPLRSVWGRTRDTYCITNERVMILRGSGIRTIYLVELHSVLLKEAGDGSGTIVIGDDYEGTTYGAIDKGRRILAPRIADVADVRTVYRTLEDARMIAHKGNKPSTSS